MKQRKYFLLALIFALLAAGAVYFYLEDLQQRAKQSRAHSPILLDTILVAKADIPARTWITEDMLTYAKIPTGHTHPQAVLEKERVIGSITRFPVFADEQLLRERLVFPDDTGIGLSFMITKGKRAITIAIDEVSGVGRMILPEDRVDILVHLTGETEGELEYATFLLQNIKVLAIGQVVYTETFSLDGNTITLEVTPAEAQKLSLAIDHGFNRLLLREATDDEIIMLEPFTTEDLCVMDE